MTTFNKIKTLNKSDYQNYFNKGINYQQYKQQMAEDLALNPDLKIKEYIHLNQRRMHRVEKTFEISPEFMTQVQNLKHTTNWLIITEHWCGDASQTIPVFDRLAEMSNGKIEMRLVYRDENPELVDAHLTNGTRSIPKLVQLDEHFNVTGIWGPRPSEAQQLVKLLKADPATAATYSTNLHLWYAKDKQKSQEAEIGTLLMRANLFCPSCLS